MIILTEYELIEKPPRGFFVISYEKSICPCCSCGRLKCIGSRKRTFINESSECGKLVIRRLRCKECVRIHHELPGMLAPYKRHESKSIEAVIDNKAGLCVAADDSTIRLWREWFKGMAEYLAGCLESVAARFGIGMAVKPEDGGCSPLKRIKRQVGTGEGWLARVVRTVANMNLWVHTRSAFQTG